MPATKARANALGFITPAGTDNPRAGDDAITANALLSAETRDLLTAATLDLRQVKANATTQTAATAETLAAFDNRIAALYTAASNPDSNAAVAAVESRHWADQSETSASTAAGSANAAAGSATQAAASANAAAGSATQAAASANAAAGSATQVSNALQYELRGEGSPVGRITPLSRGVYYTDTTGAGGVWRWLWNGAKWLPAVPATARYDLVAGDFGASFAPAAQSSSISVFRDGNTVTMAAEFRATAATSGASAVAQLPAGYRPLKYQWLTSASPTGYSLAVSSAGTLVCNTAATSGTVIRAGGISWITGDDWPA